MSGYDPFARGPTPVGVRSTEVVDADRDRALPVEVWYPAAESFGGHDLDDRRDQYEMMEGLPPLRQDAVRDATPATEQAPAVVFSHGLAGHRRQTTHLCTHLASHGYVVAAADHLGNTTADVMGAFAAGAGPESIQSSIRASMDDRPLDVSVVVDALEAGRLGVEVGGGPVGVAGHSFGGWTALNVAGRDGRVGAVVALAPAVGGPGSREEQLAEFGDRLDLDWDRSIPVLVLAADEDSVIPLDGIQTLLDRSDAVDRLVVLTNADHFHFCDRAEVIHDLMAPMMGGQTKTSDEFVPGVDAYEMTNGLGLAHFDATLRSSSGAEALLRSDPVEVLASRGVDVTVLG